MCAVKKIGSRILKKLTKIGTKKLDQEQATLVGQKIMIFLNEFFMKSNSGHDLGGSDFIKMAEGITKYIELDHDPHSFQAAAWHLVRR
jgi:hypothetical protein